QHRPRPAPCRRRRRPSRPRPQVHRGRPRAAAEGNRRRGRGTGVRNQTLRRAPLPRRSRAPKPPPQRSIIARVRTPNAPGSGALLVSPDGQALLMVVELTTEYLSRRNWPTIAKVENLIDDLRRGGEVPDGLDVVLLSVMLAA